ncbi:helix-turn-helix domain-containing protein [Sandaracinobacter neustonicus]|uniref:Helix-turn-helix domain-containing protein n=1 Tax=Sandaracinobacter neustonicus TaxID=1715348 RepID=A0A501XT22_9SPHN|nr:XRE family transcriptional regulator [Sandaracinobacter neustonicus]TPE63730.1 helix-turn-helix domain-containing protein [Sandaracinobacter neustonicus]
MVKASVAKLNPSAGKPQPRTAAAPPAASASSRPTLGSLLRALRVRNQWTLKDMSERTGIPVSTLSKIEHDRLTLTYDRLLQLSERLNMRLSDLFAEPESMGEPDRVTARRSIGLLESALQVSTANYDYYYLFPELRQKRMIPIITHVRARTLAEFGDLVRHSGEEWIYVVSGRIRVHSEFYETITLETGQSVYLDSNMGHAYVLAEGCDEAVVIGACASGEPDQMQHMLEHHSPVSADPA